MKRNTVIGLGVAGVLVLWSLIGAFNLASKNATLDGKVGDVWNAIERANELLPRLEGQLKFTTAEQQKVIDQITAGRNNLLAAQRAGNIQQAVDAARDAQLAINIVVERYPDFGIPEVQRGLLSETAGSVNRVAYARSELIRAQADFNRARIGSGPIGWLFFEKKSVLGSNADPTTRIEPSRLPPS
jgi:LemA protein